MRIVPTSILAAVLLAIAASTLVDAQATKTRGFLCEKVWKGPSKDNSLADCFTNVNHMVNDYLLTAERLIPLIVGVLCLLTGVFMLIIFPCFLCFRYCCNCCGGRSRRPDSCCCGDSAWDDKTEEEINRAYEPGSVRCTKACAFLIFVLSIIAVITSLVGSSLVVSSYGSFFENAKSVLDWANAKKDTIRVTMTVPDENGVPVLVPPMTDALFDDMGRTIADYRGQLSSVQNQYGDYVNRISIAGIAISVVPFASIIVTVLCAIFNIRSVVLFLNAIIHWLFILPYGILGGILLILSVPFVDFEGERQKLLANQSGLLTWWAVPYMDSVAPFNSMSENVKTAEISNSQETCRTLQSIATSASTTYSLRQPNIIYNWNVTDPVTSCSSVTLVDYAFNSMRIFADSPIICEGVARVDQLELCNISRCANNCSQETVRTTAKTAYKYFRFGKAAIQAFFTLLPLLQFIVVLTELFTRLSVLATLSDSMTLVGAGLCMFCVFFIIDLFVIFRGQKRFFALTSIEDEKPVDASQMQQQHGGAEVQQGSPIYGTAVVAQPQHDGPRYEEPPKEAAGEHYSHQEAAAEGSYTPREGSTGEPPHTPPTKNPFAGPDGEFDNGAQAA